MKSTVCSAVQAPAGFSVRPRAVRPVKTWPGIIRCALILQHSVFRNSCCKASVRAFTPAYNVSKAGVKAFTEALQHELRNTAGGRISAHLFIPGFVFTGLTARGRTEKPAGAWTPEQTVDFMIERIEANDFYILCPDNDAPRRLDERRILWAASDIVENRPALSRWHPDYAEAFAAFVKGS